MKDLKDILSHFSLAGKILEIKPLGAGLINDSYKVTTAAPDTPDYVLQRINHSIFKDVDMLQNNFYQVTTHIRHKLETKGETDIDRKVLTLIPTTMVNYTISMEKVIGEYSSSFQTQKATKP